LTGKCAQDKQNLFVNITLMEGWAKNMKTMTIDI